MKPIPCASLVPSALLAGCAGRPPPSPATFTGPTECNGMFTLQKASADGFSVVLLQMNYGEPAESRPDVHTPDLWHTFDVADGGSVELYMWQYTPDTPPDLRRAGWEHFTISADERYVAAYWKGVSGRVSVRYSTNETSKGLAAVASFRMTDLRVRDGKNRKYRVPDFSIQDVEVTHHTIE